MPRSTNARSLTAAFVRSVKEPGKYHDGKGTGLYLFVKPSAARSWVQRIMIRGNRREMGLGSPPIVTLAEAREQAITNKRVAYFVGDPLIERRRAREVPTFRTAAHAAHGELAPTWKNPKDRDAFINNLSTYVFPHFGDAPIPDVTSADVRKAILAARAQVPGVARKLTYRVSAVFRWAIAEGHCSVNPATRDALALPRVERAPVHRKSLPYDDVSKFIETLRSSQAGATTKLALEFLILTACRSGEARNARWKQVSFGPDGSSSVTWTIPPDIAKSKRPFRVPLSDRAVEILRDAEELSNGSGLLFPGARSGKALSDMTLSKLVKGLGFDVDVHGFRASFRTWAQERTDYPREVCEAALAHKIGDAAEQAYARSDVFEKRRELMGDWSRFLGDSHRASVSGRSP